MQRECNSVSFDEKAQKLHSFRPLLIYASVYFVSDLNKTFPSSDILETVQTLVRPETFCAWLQTVPILLENRHAARRISDGIVSSVERLILCID